MKLIPFIILIIIFFSGCSDSDKTIKVLDKYYADTTVGTTINQKFIKEVTIKKIKKIEIKKIKKKLAKIIKLKTKFVSVAQKKQYFKDTLVPIITEVYNELNQQYNQIQNDIANNTNVDEIQRLRKYYELKDKDNLLESLKPHPISIVLAQAAIESAWLTSRFTKEANNIFGVWSFNKKEPRIAASGLRGDKTIYLKKYASIKQAITDYYKNLGRHRAYKEFRSKRVEHDDPYKLVLHLKSYSEKKEEYTKMLQKVIRYNKFDTYDINNSK